MEQVHSGIREIGLLQEKGSVRVFDGYIILLGYPSLISLSSQLLSVT